MNLQKRNPVLLIVVVMLTITIVFVGNGLPYGKFSWSDIVSAQDGETTFGYGQPGCAIEIPVGSVVGQFVSDATVYWAPHVNSGSPYIIDDQDDRSKTAWVIGQDVSESFYKIIWACQEVWISKPFLGPNPDEAWRGTPLPTRIVE